MDGFVASISGMVDKVRGTPLERKVKEATSNEPWGCTGEVKNEIAKATYNYQHYKEVMGTLWKRMEMPHKNWRGVFKALELLEFLLKAGSQRVTEEAREKIHRIRSLEHFTYDDPADGTDKGTGVRSKAESLMKLIRSEKALHKLRDAHRKNKSKFSSVSSEGGRGFGGGTSYGGYGYDRNQRHGGSGLDGFGSESALGGGRRKKKKKHTKPKYGYNDDEDEVETKKSRRSKKTTKKKKKKKVVVSDEDEDEDEDDYDDVPKKKTKKKSKKIKKTEKKSAEGKNAEVDFEASFDEPDAGNSQQPAENGFDFNPRGEPAPAPAPASVVPDLFGNSAALAPAPAAAANDDDGWGDFGSGNGGAATAATAPQPDPVMSAFNNPSPSPMPGYSAAPMPGYSAPISGFSQQQPQPQAMPAFQTTPTPAPMANGGSSSGGIDIFALSSGVASVSVSEKKEKKQQAAQAPKQSKPKAGSVSSKVKKDSVWGLGLLDFDDELKKGPVTKEGKPRGPRVAMSTLKSKSGSVDEGFMAGFSPGPAQMPTPPQMPPQMPTQQAQFNNYGYAQQQQFAAQQQYMQQQRMQQQYYGQQQANYGMPQQGYGLQPQSYGAPPQKPQSSIDAFF